MNKNKKSWRGIGSRRHTPANPSDGMSRPTEFGGSQMNMSMLITEKVVDSNLVNAANRRAAKYIHDKKPQGIDYDDVRDEILKEFYLRRDAINAAAEKKDAVALGDTLKEAVKVALGNAANASHKHIRKLIPFQVRNAETYLEDKAWEDLARDMADYFFCQSRRETEAWFVRCAIRHLSPSDRRIAEVYMEEESWERVAHRFGMNEGNFRRRVLPGFIVRFKDEWAKCW